MPTDNEPIKSSMSNTSTLFLRDFDQLRNLSGDHAKRQYDQLKNSQNKMFFDQYLKSESKGRITDSMSRQGSHVPQRNPPS